jgi:putative acetyltransferase
MSIAITKDDLTGPEIAALLTAHMSFAQLHSPPESIHAMPLDGLRGPNITLWTAWDGAALLSCGALKQLDPSHGEVKSMHTAAAHRRKGIAALMLGHIIDQARQRSYCRLSLETGSMDAFAASRALYALFGFLPCDPFADYGEDPHSVFMTLDLTGPA